MMEALSSRGIQIIAVGRSEMRSTAFSFCEYSSTTLPRKTSPRKLYFVEEHLENKKIFTKADVFKYVVLILLNLFRLRLG